MIFAICGTPGSYKSCYAVEKFVLPALKKGRKVFTNIEGLNPSYIATYYDLDPIEVNENLNILGRVYDDDGSFHEDRDRIRRFYEDLPLNALVIIDEAQNYFSSRDFKEGYSADLIPWLTKHRHLGNDVVWITQSLESVDITFRRQTALTYALKRTENLGLKNGALNYIFDRADLERRHLSRKMYRPDPTVFKLYSSYQNKEVKENRKSYNVFLRSPFVWLMLVCFAWAGYTILSGNLERNVFKRNVKEESKVVEEKEKNEVVENEESFVFPSGVCIKSVAKVRGQKKYYLSDGSIALDGSGLFLCPTNKPKPTETTD